jgi:hypothetical protein
MWDIENLRPASGEACQVATALVDLVSRNELGDSRLPDFVSLSALFRQPCLPFREHDVESLSPHIYKALKQHGESQIVIFQNPLYDGSLKYTAEADLNNVSEVNALIEEKFFSGGFIISTISPRFRWFGNFTDYGFMFTDEAVIEAIFLAPAAITYTGASRDFRLGEGGDLLLDPEIRKLDQLWSSIP